MVAVYGATGFTGKLVAAELSRRGLSAVLCGRSADKLAAVAAPHGFATRVAAHDDPAALEAAFADCGAVVSCAGPFLQVGEEVVKAAIAAGCHYVDTTGETPFIRRCIEVHGPAAQAAGVAVVSGIGFDYLPGDLAASLAAEGRGPLDELIVAYAVQGFGATRGTTRSALIMLAEGDPRTLVRPRMRTFDFPRPTGRKAVSAYPSGEEVTVPRHVDTARVTPVITSETFMPVAALAPAVPFLTAPVGLVMRSQRLRKGLDRIIDRLPEGPRDEKRAAVRWAVTAEARPAAGGSANRVTVSGPDIYGVTAAITVEAAKRMTAEGYDRRGGLAPAEAFDAQDFLRALAPFGVIVT